MIITQSPRVRPRARAVYDLQLLISGEHSMALSVDEPIVAALNIYVDISADGRRGGGRRAPGAACMRVFGERWQACMPYKPPCPRPAPPRAVNVFLFILQLLGRDDD